MKTIDLVLSASIVEEIESLLSEAATEISNLDSPVNPVVRRLKVMRQTLEAWGVDEE